MKQLRDDSRKVKEGDIFFAIPCADASEMAHAMQALELGASSVVSALPAPQGYESRWAQVNDVHFTRYLFAKEHFGNPFEKLNSYAVTGSNGKTSCAFMMNAVLRAEGKKTALLSTIYNLLGDEKEEARLTTPGFLELYEFAARAVKAGCTELIMEVSSHALVQGRVMGIPYKTAMFTNLSHEHLDFHGVMENYYQAKKILFTSELLGRGVGFINIDNSYGNRLHSELFFRERIGVSKKQFKISESEKGIKLDGYDISLFGEFNLENAMLIIEWAREIGCQEKAIANALANMSIPGRFEVVYNKNNRKVIVDYAHTPDALQRTLQAARQICKGNLHLVFGCGGDRDKTKRPEMAKIAETLADQIYLTSDNPRTENPEQILADIEKGMTLGKHKKQIDRKKAIKAAATALQSGDILVVAGKGHENYQLVGTEKKHFSDREEILGFFL
ncbi:MAG: UDP-N-acetylmuramoyl-L-alanyl-D-glutamate--2,6-diaminopimelate ligase [Fibromonadaceae bacterium]|jgi:UDP-N-acetylmuramoyl-L-alanyl-D-glutamate--2,6-diaminopimelate ligase|nr:UDP-N-acetylmuramoyl-L-alanyl-D-glutamate--2,6-diaminopimelate ligase [Fibromonadaceae bacterium]